MFAKLNHVAIVSDNYATQAVFYKALFDLKSGSSARFEATSMALGDGYVGMQIIPRPPGRQAGFDHFGVQVDDVELVRERVAKKWPGIGIIQRPSNRPFAAFGIHDPAGTYFDLSQRGLRNRGEVYEKPAWEQERVFTHFALRALEPARLAEFYNDVLELSVVEIGDAFHLSDGRITFVILPWRIADFIGSGIERPAMDHLGFEVENIETFKRDLSEISRNAALRPKAFGAAQGEEEGAAREALFQKTAMGDFYMCDIDGVLLAIRERAQQEAT